MCATTLRPHGFRCELLHRWDAPSLATPAATGPLCRSHCHPTFHIPRADGHSSHPTLECLAHSDCVSCCIRQRSRVRSAEPIERKKRADARRLSSVRWGLQRHLLMHDKQRKISEQEEEGDKSGVQRRPLAVFVSAEDHSTRARCHFSQKQAILWEFEFVI